VKQVLLFDIDNTLTPPRLPLTQEMAEILSRLRLPFHVAAGSDLALVDDQFLGPLFEFGFRGVFDAFLSNGAIHYRCNYVTKKDVEEVSRFNIKEYLGGEDYRRVIEVLESVLAADRFRLPGYLKIIGDRVIDRGSMINLCPIGRIQRETPESLANRAAFVKFDQLSGFRKQVIEFLETELSGIMKGRRLTITLGGQTSFDLGIADQDKTVAVRQLLKDGVDSIVFFGDALFEGGNDASLRKFIENWPSSGPCPLEAIQVDSWKQTVETLYERGLLESESLRV
jgi:phosphomannomutase